MFFLKKKKKKDGRARCNFQTVFQLYCINSLAVKIFVTSRLLLKIGSSSRNVAIYTTETNNKNIMLLQPSLQSATQPFLVSSRRALLDDTNNGCVADYYHCDQKRFLEEITFLKKHTEELKYDNTHSKLCKLVKCLETCGVTTPVNTFILCVKF